MLITFTAHRIEVVPFLGPPLTVRYDWLNQYHFSSLDKMRIFAAEWLWVYNNERPNMELGGITPMQHLAITA